MTTWQRWTNKIVEAKAISRILPVGYRRKCTSDPRGAIQYFIEMLECHLATLDQKGGNLIFAMTTWQSWTKKNCGSKSNLTQTYLHEKVCVLRSCVFFFTMTIWQH
jgi:hypothetical protein